MATPKISVQEFIKSPKVQNNLKKLKEAFGVNGKVPKSKSLFTMLRSHLFLFFL